MRALMPLALGLLAVSGAAGAIRAEPLGGPGDVAADAPTPGSPAPWNASVSDADRAAAEAVYDRATRHQAEKEYALAVVDYRKALALWDHPAIGYTFANCLVEMGDNVAAAEALRHALRFGQGPLDDETYANALRTQKLLDASVAVVVVACDLEGAAVSLDGAPLFVAPGEATRRAAPGPHLAVAQRPGYVTRTTPFDAPAGRETRLDLSLDRAMRVETRRPMAASLPWLVLGAGTAVAAVGVPLWLSADASFGEYDRGISSACPTGCPSAEIPAGLKHTLDRAEAQHAGAVSLFVVGGLALATGVALLVLNSPESVEVPVDLPPGDAPKAPSVEVMPGLGGGSVTLRF
ncbi:MAG: tetratricopeptide repeat protein [Myxococcota bacterium]